MYTERHNQVAGIVCKHSCASYGLEVPNSQMEDTTEGGWEQQGYGPVGLQAAAGQPTTHSGGWHGAEDHSGRRCGSPRGQQHEKREHKKTEK